MPPRVTIVIPNWNGKKFLDVCLTSLRNQSFKDFRTTIVDNGSADGSVEYVEQNFPEVRVLPLGENRGFSAGVNAGIRDARSEYVALLNTDTEGDQGWI